MLVLSRYVGEKIFIGENIVITILESDRCKIRLGVIAPREIEILRGELLHNDDPRLKATSKKE